MRHKAVATPPAAGGTSVTDDFNRADGGLGSNWTAVSGGTAPTISSNVAVGAAAASRGAYWSADTFSNDQYAEIDVTLGTAGGYSDGWVSVRQQTGSDSGYWAFWHNYGGGTYVLQRRDSGSGTAIDTEVTGVGTTGTRTLRVEVTGTSVVMKVDGVTQQTATDSTYTSGYPAIGMYCDSSPTSTLDNFAAGDL